MFPFFFLPPPFRHLAIFSPVSEFLVYETPLNSRNPGSGIRSSGVGHRSDIIIPTVHMQDIPPRECGNAIPEVTTTRNDLSPTKCQKMLTLSMYLYPRILSAYAPILSQYFERYNKSDLPVSTVSLDHSYPPERGHIFLIS